MKRILILLVIALALSGSVVSFGQTGNKLPRRVPKGKTFIYLNDSGKEIGRRRAGQLARRRNIIDCAQIPCPPTFPSDAVCWKCVERPSSVTTR
jgi:hypothetical protein